MGVNQHHMTYPDCIAMQMKHFKTFLPNIHTSEIYASIFRNVAHGEIWQETIFIH